MKRTAQNRFKALTSACVLSMMATVAWSQQPSITWLGVLPNGTESVAYGVSQDGSVVVGVSFSRNGRRHAFRWTRTNGMQDLGTLGGDEAVALAVSANGITIVGWSYLSYNSVKIAFRWVSGSMQNIGYDVATCVSATGAVVAGYYLVPGYGHLAFRWTQATGLQRLDSEFGGSECYAYGISLDGIVIVGAAANSQGRLRAFRKPFPGVMTNLGTLGGDRSIAYATSGNGTVVVGTAENENQFFRPFRWTEAEGMQNLGTFGGSQGEARGVSVDGSVVVGWASNEYELPRAFRWIAGRGLQDLNEVYASLLANGSELNYAYAISPNGRYIVGSGFNIATGRIEAFLLDTAGTTGCRLDADVNRDGTVDDADLLQVLFSFGSGC